MNLAVRATMNVVTLKLASTVNAKTLAHTNHVESMLIVLLMCTSQSVHVDLAMMGTPMKFVDNQNAEWIQIVLQPWHAGMKNVLILVTVQPMLNVMPEIIEATAPAYLDTLEIPTQLDATQYPNQFLLTIHAKQMVTAQVSRLVSMVTVKIHAYG